MGTFERIYALFHNIDALIYSPRMLPHSNRRGSPFRARVHLQTWVYIYPDVAHPGEFQAMCKALEDSHGRKEN